jgi:site-specific DNA-methyltransferase (adenine-specific)
MACAIENAGFELRDQIMWLYGSGFPKSRNLDGAWDGWGTALKPAHEPICVARKPLVGKTVAANVLEHGTGALNIERCRIAGESTLRTQVGTTQAWEGGAFSGSA